MHSDIAELGCLKDVRDHRIRGSMRVHDDSLADKYNYVRVSMAWVFHGGLGARLSRGCEKNTVPC